MVGRKGEQRWLWQALHHRSGTVVADGFGKRQDQALVELTARLQPVGIRRYDTHGWGAYQRHGDPKRQEIGTRSTQRLARKHLTLRTRSKRLVRKTICFSRSTRMHDMVIGLFMNRFEVGVSV